MCEDLGGLTLVTLVVVFVVVLELVQSVILGRIVVVAEHVGLVCFVGRSVRGQFAFEEVVLLVEESVGIVRVG